MPNKYEEISSIIIIISVVILLLVVFIGLILILYYLRRIKSIKEEKKLKDEFSQTLMQSQIEIQEQTLQHISRELHDNLGQVASLIKINLNTLKLSGPDSAVEKIENTKELTRQLIADIKSLSVSLGSDRIVQTGLAKALETEVERLNKTGQFSATYQLNGTIPDIDKDKAIILYRMSQEVLNNMVNHSRASRINILITVTENLFTLVFSDNGWGFNVQEKMTNSIGAGLRNLHNRAQLINAQLSIQSTPGNGTETTIELPFK